ncbi:MAG: leishmanolysin-related zinc metalloendopeptidase [Gemmatimonadales bacterium]
MVLMCIAKQVAHILCGIAAIALVPACQTADRTGPAPADPSAMALVSGNGQAGLAGQPLAQPLVVRVTTASGAGTAGVAVTWAVTAGGGTLSATSTITDEGGQASATWTLGEVVGANAAQATASGLSGSPVSFAAASTAGLPTQLALISGNNQTGTVGQALAESLVVVARDRFDNPVGGATVTWAVSAGGSLGSTTAGRADAQGRSSVAWTLGPRAGGQIVTASFPGATGSSVVCTAVARSGPAAALTFTVQPTNTTVGSAIAPAVEVSVVDSFGNIVISAQDPVAVALGANPGGATLTGTIQVNALNGVAAFSSLTIDRSAVGYTLSAVATGLPGVTSAPFTVSPPPPATHLVFAVQPGNAAAGTAIAPPILVTARDAQGRTATSFGGNVTVGLTANPGSGTLSGTTTVTATAGVATFADLTIDRTGLGYALQASAGGLAADTSAPFEIIAGGGARLVFRVQPAAVTAGAPINTPGPGVVVAAQDSLGNTIPSFTGAVAIELGVDSSSATLSGTTTESAVFGVATFSDLSLHVAGAGYTLTATASGAASGTSAPFSVTPGPPARLAYTGQPTNATAGSAISPPVQVTALDALGNLANGFTGAVTVALSAGTGTAGATLSGTKTVTASAGVTTFADLGVDSVGTGYQLRASAGTLAPDTSSAFAVAPGPASRLVFTVQPGATTAGDRINTPGPGVVVTARDALGNTASSFSGDVRVAIYNTPPTGGGPLSGTTTVGATAGVATFSTLSISKAGSDYSLIATATGLPSDVSAAFDIIGGPASRLGFTVQPSNVLVGAAIAPAVEVTALDNQGNTATEFTGSVTMTLTPGTGSPGARLTGMTTVTPSVGVAMFSDLRIDKPANGYTFGATSGALSGTSASFTVIALASITAVAGEGQIGLIGFALNVPPAVLVRDAANLPVPNLPVTFAVASGAGSASGVAVFTDANGVATVGGWAVGPGANTLTATAQSPGVVGNPVTFTAIGVAASFDIEIRYLTGVPSDVQQAVDSAKARWQRVLFLDVPDVGANVPAGTCGPGTPAFNEPIDDIVIFVQLDSIDGPGNVLSQAAPCVVRGTGRLPAIGVLRFDSADATLATSGGALDALALHELGHVLGFGTIWPDLALIQGAGGGDPHFVGSQTIAAFDQAGGTSYIAGAKVPAENCVGVPAGGCVPGTRDRHWRESVFGGELMSGVLNEGQGTPLSDISVASMGDLGYTVNYAASDPYVLGQPLAGVRAHSQARLELQYDVLDLPVVVVDARGRVVGTAAPK